MVALRFALLTIWNQFPLHSVRKSQWLGLDDPLSKYGFQLFLHCTKNEIFHQGFFQ